MKEEENTGSKEFTTPAMFLKGRTHNGWNLRCNSLIEFMYNTIRFLHFLPNFLFLPLSFPNKIWLHL